MFGMSFDFFALGLRLALVVLVGDILVTCTASLPESAPMPWCASGAPW
jgi:hypothetical protein